ncbi:MAG: cobalamin-dependent protein [Candidatus Micrarchaeota archaeon]
MKGCSVACGKQTEKRALEILTTKPPRPYGAITEQIAKMSEVKCENLAAGKPILGKRSEDVRVALVRPLGSLKGDEEKEAVKEMGEPYQLELLAAVLSQAGYQVKIFDQLRGPYNPSKPDDYPSTKTNNEMVDEIRSYCPDAVCFSTFTYNFRRGLAIAAEIKKKLEIPVVFGGYHATSAGKQYLLFERLAAANPEGAEVFKQDLRNVFQHGIIDYACIGEGIRTIIDIMEILKQKKDPFEVSGIAFMRDGKIAISESARLDLDEYPRPFRPEGFNPMTYYATGRDYPFLILSTASGCRFSCEYCSTGMNYPGLRFRSIQSVVEELKAIRQRFYTNWPSKKIMINLTDEDFAASPRRVMNLCKAITATGLNKQFEFNSFLDNNSILGINRHTGKIEPAGEISATEMFGAMRKAGFRFCFIGIESTLDDAVEDYGRPDSFENRLAKIQQAIDRMRVHDLLYFADHIVGYPKHDLADIREDYSRLFQLRNMHYLYMPILAPMPGTPLYWRVLTGQLGNGFLPDVTYDQLDANHQVVGIHGGGDVKAKRDEAVQQFFTRPEYVEDATDVVARKTLDAAFFANMLRKISRDYPLNSKLKLLAETFAKKRS